MSNTLRCFALSLVAISSIEHASAAQGDLGLITEFHDHARYDFPCPVSAANATPEWKEGEDVPLSPKQAVQAARREMTVLFPDGSDWVLGDVTITHCAGKNHWYYLVHFSQPIVRTPAEEMIGHPLPQFAVPVLMDGVVVPPTITPAK